MTGEQRIFSCSHRFVGREQELERVIAQAHAGRSLSILAAPSAGASELLKQAYDELFLSDPVIPFYFELRSSDRDAATAGRRFAYEFLVQAVAFARRDPRLVAISPSLDELARIAPPELAWIDGAVETILSGAELPTLLAIPIRARRNVALLIDGVDRSRLIRDGNSFIDIVASIRGMSVIASGLRRMMYGRMPVEQMRLDPLSVSDVGIVVNEMTEGYELEITDATRDLIAVQMNGSLAAAHALLAEAADRNVPLNDFTAVERVYTDSIFGGRIARYLDQRIFRSLPRGVDHDAVLRTLAQTISADGSGVPAGHWRRSLRELNEPAFNRVLRHLHVQEVIAAGDGTVSMSATPRPIRDYIDARVRILDTPEKRAAIVGRATQRNLAEAPRVMTAFYRSRSALGVRRSLDSLKGQTVVRAAIDYGPFKRQLKGQDDAAIMAALRASNDLLELPHVIYTADASAFYPALAELCDVDRAAIGLTDSGEAWLVAEVDSKLEADTATAEFWCDRLEMAAINSGFDRYRLWLIAPEGFTDGAMNVLAERNTFGSSRKQVELLQTILKGPEAGSSDEIATIYEITVTMGDEGELIGAKTLNEIAEKHFIPSKAVAQIKTALVEALINAAEHSLSPDRRAHLLFEVTSGQITITVRNRGLKLTNHMLSQSDAPSERRGWGLKLIRDLMDEVRVEPTDDGTRLVMMKHFGASKTSA